MRSKFDRPNENRNHPDTTETNTPKFDRSEINPNDLNIMFCTP